MSPSKACLFLLYIVIMPYSFILMAPLAQAGTIGRAPAILEKGQTAGSAYAAMTLQQLGLLDHRSRIQYIELMRETLLELEKVQGAFQFEVALNSRGQSEFYALIFGLEVFAADKSKFYRNLNREITDEGCIYGGHLARYATAMSAYGCIRPPCTKKIQQEWKSDYAKGKTFGEAYVQCSFTSFGIEMCVTPGITSTAECDKKAREIEKKYKPSVDSFLKENITPEWMKKSAEDRLKLVSELKNWAFDPRVMSHLVKLAADIQKTQKNFDQVPELQDFEGFNVQAKGMDALFRRFKDHCTKELDEATAVKSVETEKGPWAKKRRGFLKEVKDKGKPPRVGSVIQRDECEVIIGKYNSDTDQFDGGRYKRFVDKYQEIVTKGYPDGMPNRPSPPPAGPAIARTVPETIAEPPPPAEPPVDPNGITISATTGCDPSHELLIDRGMQCAKCIAEKYYTESESGNHYSSQSGVSEKWLSLLTTMIHQCSRAMGRGTPNPKDLAHLALNYSQAFGHCSRNEYDWDALTQEQARLTTSWQMGRDLMRADAPGNKANPFEEIYGIDMKTAQELFCPGPGSGGYQNNSPRSNAGNPRRQWAQRRLQMLEVYESKVKSGFANIFGSPSSARAGIGRCLESIKQRHGNGTLFSTSDGATRCQGFVNVQPSNMQKATFSALSEQPVVAIDNNGHCYVSDTSYLYNNGKTSLIFSNPRTGGSPRPVYVADKNGVGRWTNTGGTSISYVSVGGESPERSYCPDDRGRKGYRLPPNPPHQPESQSDDTGFGDKRSNSTF
jgi:hypothetical protein